MTLSVDDTLEGFRVSSIERVDEISADAILMSHERTGARLLFLSSADENKAFSIAFRTPPQDSTGVFHILEHSVLCGSDKFPVKEPFVNLLKTSMQTFLNAMTFPDKTMYPVASTNDQDLLNLTDVYLDAVFHPAIYQRETIFQQEGWHYERAGETGLAFNGVVFNEMKGALSEPEDVLRNVLNEALFPDTAYGFESGGDPSVIPSLTYEQFLDEHRRHYRPDNSYIILYGAIDLQPMLALIDSHLNNVNAPIEGLEPRELVKQQPVISTGNVRSMAISQENACCGVAYVLGDGCDFLRLNAADILIDAIAGSNEAPLKRALLDEGVADDINLGLMDSMLQPYVLAEFTGIEPGMGEKAKALIDKHVSALIEAGIDSELIEASLSHTEFIMREHDFGYADGVINAMSSLSGWLYDDNCPLEGLRYEDMYATLRSHLQDGYFEQLARELFLENNHYASAEITVDPQAGAAEGERLAQIAETFSAEDLAQVDANVDALREAQERPDDPAAVAALPQLMVADIGDGAPWGACTVDEDAPVTCLRHNLETHGIAYMQQYYGLKCLNFSELPYAAILSFVLGKLGTAHHSAAQIDTLVQSKMGTLRFSPKVVGSDQHFNAYSVSLAVGASALESKVGDAAAIMNEIMHETDFTDTARIKDILTQLRVQMEQSFISSGHSAAMGRVGSYLREAGMISQALAGIDFYTFLKQTLADFDARAEALSAYLAEMAQLIFCPGNVLASFTGNEDAYQQFLALFADGSHEIPRERLVAPTPQLKREAFVVPGDVTFTAMGYDRRAILKAPDFHGSQLIVANAASLDFLWNEVRVKGGAYGTGLKIPAMNDIAFYSYRDPHIDETINRFKQTAQWLADFNPDQREFEGYVVSSVSAIDNPMKPRNIIVTQNNAYLQGRDPEYRMRMRDEALHATVEQVRGFAETLAEACRHECFCTIGNRDIIEKSDYCYNVIELF